MEGFEAVAGWGGCFGWFWGGWVRVSCSGGDWICCARGKLVWRVLKLLGDGGLEWRGLELLSYGGGVRTGWEMAGEAGAALEINATGI